MTVASAEVASYAVQDIQVGWLVRGYWDDWHTVESNTLMTSAKGAMHCLKFEGGGQRYETPNTHLDVKLIDHEF